MKSRTIYIFLVILIIILIFLFVFFWIVAVSFPGALLNLKRKRRKWLNHDLGKPFLTPAQVKDIRKKIDQIEPRKLGTQISTIGTAAYLDYGPDYSKKARETNKLLWKNFKPLYGKLLKHLETRLPGNYPCQYAPPENNIALPGFHIFPGNSYLGRGWAVASLHVDLQEKQVPWPLNYEFDMAETYSFTIPISVSPDSGLYVFKKQAQDLNFGMPLCWVLRNIPRQKVYYENGHCYLHHGKWFHLISPFKGKQKDGTYMDRITLQGHALFCKTTQTWWIYW